MKAKKSSAAAVGRRFAYRAAMLPAVLMLGLVLPFLFVRTAFLVLESAALCSSSIGCVRWRLFGGSDAALVREELTRALLEAASINEDDGGSQIGIEKVKGGSNRGPISFKDLVRDFTSNRHDIKTFAITTKAMIDNMERLVQRAKWHESMYWHLAAHGVPSSLHCLSLKLAEEYAVNAVARSPLPLPQHVYRLSDPFLNHIVLLTDNVLAASVVVSSAVKTSSNPERLVFHVVTDKKSYTSMHSWFSVNKIPSAVVEIKGLQQYDWPHEVNVAVKDMLEIHQQIRNHHHRRMIEEDFEFMKEHDHYRTDVLSQSCVSLLNHLRIYLPELFPDLDKVVFLDDDVVVQRDLSSLWDLDLNEKVVGAVFDPCCKYEDYFNFSNPIISSNLDQHRCGWLYGMNIFDLKQWRKSNITATYQEWLKLNLNSGYTLWRSGALPPALIAFEKLVHHLDPSWHVAGLGQRYPNVEKDKLEGGAVIHFSGPAKPWLETGSPEVSSLWYRHVNLSNEYIARCGITG
ncbi:galacturonosyltransferase 15 [Perilla frutescens var. hirtella]|nr:galacturonosyltransferase 15 [Perilla frutescens var. frutescens]KAH6775439.1 galacturonosyltransferase 15 [Perilla frutescens var. hirtella]